MGNRKIKRPRFMARLWWFSYSQADRKVLVSYAHAVFSKRFLEEPGNQESADMCRIRRIAK